MPISCTVGCASTAKLRWWFSSRHSCPSHLMNRRQAFLNSWRPTSESRYTVPTQHHHLRKVAFGGGCLLRRLAALAVTLIRIDAVWLVTEPINRRPGTSCCASVRASVRACVVKVFGAAHYGNFAKQIYRFKNLCRKPSFRLMSYKLTSTSASWRLLSCQKVSQCIPLSLPPSP